MKASAFSIYILLTIILNSEAFARWATVDEAQQTYIIDTETFAIKKDGTSVSEYQHAFIVNTESARQKLKALEIDYDSSVETARVVEASVTNGKTKTLILKKFIADESDSSSENGMDKTRIIKIALPNVIVGSVIQYKVQVNRYRPVLKGVFNKTFSFGRVATLKGAGLRIRSELPLQYRVYGPQGLIVTKAKKLKDSFEYEFTLTKDSYFKATNESPHPNWFAEPEHPLIQVTSLKNWSDLIGRVQPRIEKELSASVPSKYESILSNARSQKAFAERIDALTNGITENLRYFGDWRSADGYHFPRSLKETAELGFGDCKDFALTLAKLARALGYKAHVALIYSGEPNFKPRELPMTTDFNHMITRIEDEAGAVHWIDPTVRLSDASRIKDEISNRPALTISENVETTETTPALTPEMNTGLIEAELEHHEDGRFSISSKLILIGEQARSFISNISRKSKTQKDEYILNIFADGKEMIAGKYILDDIPRGRIAPVRMTARLQTLEEPIVTTAGFGISISSDFEEFKNFKVEDMVSGVKIGEIGTVTSRSTYKEAKLVGSLPENCTVDSPWITATRRYQATHNTVTRESIQVTKNPYISNSELKSKAFQDLRTQLRQCDAPRILIYTRTEDK